MIHADSFEAMFYDTWYGESGAIAHRLRALGVQWSAVHAEKNIGPNLVTEAPSVRESSLVGLAENCKFAKQIGAGLVVLHLWGLPDGDAKLGRQLEVLPWLTDIAEAEGVHLGIEAIPCTVNTPLENLERVVAADPRVWIVLDTEFLAMHGKLDLALDASWPWTKSRVAHIHIKTSMVCWWTRSGGTGISIRERALSPLIAGFMGWRCEGIRVRLCWSQRPWILPGRLMCNG